MLVKLALDSSLLLQNSLSRGKFLKFLVELINNLNLQFPKEIQIGFDEPINKDDT